MPSPLESQASRFSGEPFDAVQCAMHGLLETYFDELTPDEAAALADQVAAAPAGAARRSRLRRMWRRTAISAIAALLLLAAVYHWHATPTAVASSRALEDAAAVDTIWLLQMAYRDFPEPSSTDELQRRGSAVELAHLRRDLGLAVVAANPTMPMSEVHRVMADWQDYYCGLRDLGDRASALREIMAAIRYSRCNPTRQAIGLYPQIFLDGLGRCHAAFGELDAAEAAFEESLAVRRAGERVAGDPHHRDAGYEGDLANALVPCYMQLALISLSRGELAQACECQNRAERAWTQRLRTICELKGIAVAPSAGLWETWQALPFEFSQPFRTETGRDPAALLKVYPLYRPGADTCTLMRAILYHAARLAQAAGRRADARESLERAETIQDFPLQDELRLAFGIPIELARLDLMAGDLPSAEEHLRRARQWAGAAWAGGAAIVPVNQAPLPPVRVLELEILEALVARGRNPGDRTVADRMARSLGALETLTGDLPESQRVEVQRSMARWRDAVSVDAVANNIP